MSYQVWITITINHTYFNAGKCGIELSPTAPTIKLLRKAGILFRKQNAVTWLLIKCKEESGRPDFPALVFEDGKSRLDFDLIALFPDFEYCTQWKKQLLRGAGWVLRNRRNACGGNKYLQIPVSTRLLGENTNVGIEICSREVIWEFILIPKYTERQVRLELKEDTGRLIFTPVKEVEFPGEIKAFRCVSVSSVDMKETYNYRISLWERKEDGEILLSNNVPFPKSHALSLEKPKEMITSYFYF
ncbi:MAG: hypothetical protein LBU57_09515 [Dysgonamonadaceae bacterium]|jgi:hypothetical protein|nr:hypothetical protein [Dysgonamonadaceae bacterium]